MNDKGFSLTSALVAAGIVGALALAIVRVMGNITHAYQNMDSLMNEAELRNEIRLILNDPNSCRVSMAGEGKLFDPLDPVRFKKRDHDEVEKKEEGLDVELFLADQSGEKRLTKKFSTQSEKHSTYGNITIKKLKLYFNNGLDKNYVESDRHMDFATLNLVIEKKIGNTSKREKELNAIKHNQRS